MTPGWCAQGSIRPLEYLWLLDLPEQADPLEILSVDGGYRVTDSFEVFPKIECRDMIFPFDGHGSVKRRGSKLLTTPQRSQL